MSQPTVHEVNSESRGHDKALIEGREQPAVGEGGHREKGWKEEMLRIQTQKCMNYVNFKIAG